MKKHFYLLHSEICQTLANPIRLEIIDSLRYGALSVSELAEKVAVTSAHMSQHLAVLRSKGVVATEKRGTSVLYQLSNPKILQAYDLISEVMVEQVNENNRMIMNATKLINTGRKR